MSPVPHAIHQLRLAALDVTQRAIELAESKPSKVALEDHRTTVVGQLITTLNELDDGLGDQFLSAMYPGIDVHGGEGHGTPLTYTFGDVELMLAAGGYAAIGDAVEYVEHAATPSKRAQVVYVGRRKDMPGLWYVLRLTVDVDEPYDFLVPATLACVRPAR